MSETLVATLDWQVRVYVGRTVVATWLILNRTETEAIEVAASDIAAEYPNGCDDWAFAPWYGDGQRGGRERWQS